jgi:NAD(P)H-hydrate epimerase
MCQIEKIACEHGICEQTMMENAGRGCADWVCDRYATDRGYREVLIFCGHGNNGGDGFVIGRYLSMYGYNVEILLLGDVVKMSEITRANYHSCIENNIAVRHECIDPQSNDNDIIEKWDHLLKDNKYHIVIDAIYGIGFQGLMSTAISYVISELLRSKAIKIAIDMPSGIDADTGENHYEPDLAFDYTLTLGMPKLGLYINEVPKITGEVVIIDFGLSNIPNIWEKLYKQSNALQGASSLNIEYFLSSDISFPLRKKKSHKGDYGKIAIIAGSPGKTGAAILSSRAALATGGGLITLYHQPGLEAIFQTTLIEVMTQPITPEDHDMWSHIYDSDAILIGPGLGTTNWATDILAKVLQGYGDKPLVIDADAINLVAMHPQLCMMLSGRRFAISTPHVKEFCRLSGVGMPTLQKKTIQTVRDFCEKNDTQVLLKNHFCICDTNCSESNGTSSPICTMITGGNDGLATGGSGDALAGMIVSWVAQDYVRLRSGSDLTDKGINPAFVKTSVCSAVKYFYQVAEHLAKKYYTPAITPSMIIKHLFKKDIL